ncbi:deoxyguanosinetriphosphate triphosphohydrolase [Anaeromyxobacter dehalogenans]|uniref:Deoxyguanosinetriphosphate triphosphohydrolase n=1 Tax=Anaeromyxobacter dehalogenans (strain 2CP-C) TaxID=290397 RepID=Q2IL28_ANADE|nr:deoxyguanosinetriphosphate triphosphohydrolase [Anaeromyxobacter dehalogenans]ABC82360.1 Deoxyguanosinetriphosphate triphosphohydrolase [Anaeromyxobacter dehalogenans 2CP-C]
MTPGSGTIREMLEDLEERTLHPRAARSAASRGRARPEEPDPERPAFQRDRDRLLHCKAFRRLAGKTQVFLAPRGDHYRTRLTHTLEVAQVARSIARALRLNEMLVEAMVMGHDLGHTPFGHAGERVLNQEVPGGFHHVVQSVRVVDVLEKDGRGLNLTAEVRDGILRHSKGKGNVLLKGSGEKALTLEAEIVRIADIVAYVNHDLDDALRAGLFAEADLPADIRRTLGGGRSERFATLVHDVIRRSDVDGGGHIEMSPDVHQALLALRDFLYARVYENPVVHDEFVKAQRILRDLWEWCLEDPARLATRHGVVPRDGEGLERAVTDWLSGMTDRFALATWEELFVPRPWSLL